MRNQAHNCRAIVWDFDGTMVTGAREMWPKVEARALCELGITKFGPELPRDVYNQVDALSQEDTWKFFCDIHGLKATAAEWKQAVSKHLAPVAKQAAKAKILQFRKHVLETMKHTRALGIRAAIATMSDRYELELTLDALSAPVPALRKLGIEHILTPEDLSQHRMKGKPAPDIYTLAAEKLGVPPGTCVAIEDTPGGASAAAAAGYGLVIARAEQPEPRFWSLGAFEWQVLESQPGFRCNNPSGISPSTCPIVILTPETNPSEIIEAWSQSTNGRTFPTARGGQ
jgi:beta-phosphoglucomutase-like phosphatase (HAD superfamily)